jgi:hypothetical protein
VFTLRPVGENDQKHRVVRAGVAGVFDRDRIGADDEAG